MTTSALEAPVVEQPEQTAPSTAETCDGLVCFAAVDWWYHNRGHSECQIMRRLARRVPVLWINSIGMRAPMPGTSDIVLRRYARKLRSTMKGLCRETDGMWVYSPVFVPRYTDRMVSLNGRLLATQVRWLLKRIGIRRPAAWVTIPTAVAAVEQHAWSRVVFNRSDDFAAFPEADRAFVRGLEKRLLAAADDVVYVNRTLYERERQAVPRPHYMGHGVDYEHFSSARLTGRPAESPARVRDLPRPILGFYGALDGYTVDLDLMLKVARSFPSATLLVIGPRQMDTARLEAEPNVVYLGPVPYAQLPEYAAQFDVGLMPWLQNEWIAACNPIKLKEYLALGFPTVTTRFRELQAYEPLVYAAGSHDEFLAQIRRALREDDRSLVHRRRNAVVDDSWDRLTDQVAGLFALSADAMAVPRIPIRTIS